MKKRNLAILFIASILCIGGVVGYKLITQPLNMRFSDSSVDPWRLAKYCERCWSINRTGLAEANFSGSGALVLDHLKGLQEKLGPNLLVINGLPGKVWHLNGRHLRHLCYTFDGTTVTHRNRKKDNICNLRRLIAGVPFKAEEIDPSQIYTESSKMDELGINYINPLSLSWASDWRYVEELLEIFENTDPHVTHLHFHCEHGKGRTTTLMVLYDIYRNAHQVPLQDIVDRNFCLGGEDLMNTIIWKKGTWTQEGLLNRKHLVTAFYDYMNDPHGHGELSWTTWLKKKQEEGYAYLPVGTHRGDPHRKATEA